MLSMLNFFKNAYNIE